MKYTKSALGLLNAQYRSVLKKCLLINLGLFALATVTATPAMADWDNYSADTSGFSDTVYFGLEHDEGLGVVRGGIYYDVETSDYALFENGAQVNTIETIKVNGTALTPDGDRAVNITVPTISADPDEGTISITSGTDTFTFYSKDGLAGNGGKLEEYVTFDWLSDEGYQTSTDVSSAIAESIDDFIGNADGYEFTEDTPLAGVTINNHDTNDSTVVDALGLLNDAVAGKLDSATAASTYATQAALGEGFDAEHTVASAIAGKTTLAAVKSDAQSDAEGSLGAYLSANYAKSADLGTMAAEDAGDYTKTADLGSAAFEDADAFDAAGSATAVQTAVTSGTITAAKATADADGNEISATYAKSADLGAAAYKGVDTAVTEDSTNLVTSGAVFAALASGAADVSFDTVETGSLTIGENDALTNVQTTIITAGSNNTIATTAAVYATTGQISGLRDAYKQELIEGGMDEAEAAGIAANLYPGSTVSNHLTALASAIGNRTDYTGANYLENNQDIATSLTALDGALGNVEDLVGSQTTAWGTGPLVGKTIGKGAASDVTVASALGLLNGAAKTNADNITAINSNITVTAEQQEASNHLTAGADVAHNLVALDNALGTAESNVAAITTDTATGEINVANANVGTQLKVGDSTTNSTLTNNALTTATVNATTVNAGANGTALTDGQLALNDGTNTATLTSTANGLNVAEGLTVGTAGSEKFKVTAAGDTTVNSLKIGESGTTISSITTASGVAALIADPTSASDNKLMTEAAVVSGIKALVDQKEAWAQGLLGVDTTQGTDNQLQNALNDLGTTDTKGNNIASTTIAGALHELDVEKAGLDQNNVFTGANTFASAAGIKIGNMSDTTDAGYKEVAITTTTAGALNLGGNTEIDGTLTIGGANAITGTANSLDMGKNALTNVKGLTLTDGEDDPQTATLSINANGEIATGNASINAGTGTVTAASHVAGANGTALSDNSLVLKGSGTGVQATLTGTANGLNVAEGLTVATDKFTVDASGNMAASGNADIAGTLDVGTNNAFHVAANGTVDINNASGKSTFEASTSGLKIGTDVSDAATTNFTVAADSGNVVTKGTVQIGGTSGATLSYNSSSDTISSDKKVVSANGFEVNADNSFTAGAFKLAGTTVNTIDTAGAAATIAGGSPTALATVNTVKVGAESADYTTVGANIAAATTIGTAIHTLDTEIGADIDYASANNGVAGTNSVKANINAINAKVGNVADVAVNGYTASSGTLTGAVSKLNTNMTNVLGAVYKADGTYDATKLTADMYKGGSSATSGADLTGSLNNLADNITAITGGSMNAGVVENDYMTGVTAVDYTALADNSATPLASAIGQINKNIGIAANGTKGNIVATNTVNANLDALDTAIGDRSNIGSANTAINTAIQTDVATAVKKIGDEIGSQAYVNNKTVSYDAIAANTDLTNAVSQVASNIGTASDFATTTKGNVAATNTVNANLNTLDDHMGDLANLKHNAFGGTTNTGDITTAMNSLATNVATGMGGSFAADGTWSDKVVNTTSNGYTYTATANIMDSLDQVAGNVGTKDQLANQYNGVTNTQTVNTNLNAINGTIGDITTLSDDTGGSVGNALSNGTGVKPTTVVTALNNIDATLGKIHGLKASSDLGDKSNLAEGTTVENHLVSIDNAIGDRSFTTTRYVAPNSDLATAVTALDSNLNRVEHKVNDLRHDFEAGMASMAAMSALVPNPRSSGDTSLSIGTGAYGGHTAVAFGGFHYLTDNILLNAGASWGNTDDMAYRLGVTWSW